MLENFLTILHVFKIVAFWSSINVFGWRLNVFKALCNVHKVIGIIIIIIIIIIIKTLHV
jgi:hypothetical protein